ncbi:MAG: class I SAM-dependent methyltransferase [Burkholderiales bacterium]|nr:class I SAM-dependent methyltransferase [Burkholderiales bacterium]
MDNQGTGAAAYGQRAAAEIEAYRNNDRVHDLPEIFHYWSNKFLKPKFDAMAIRGVNEFFEDGMFAAARATSQPAPKFLSIGAGNCDVEIGVAAALIGRGLQTFTIECLELNPSMLARGRSAAEARGVAQHIVFSEGDFNSWCPRHKYSAVMANQSLHHVLALEHLFDGVLGALLPGGQFIVSDIIGRNGHLRWPEALSLVHEFWVQLPPRYRYNLLLRRHEELYENWDCSTEGFEGIRAQDVLPELMKRFHFKLFLPFSNVMDVFIDRCFGHHFSPNGEWDCHFIDRLNERDEAAIVRGDLTPTHMLAVLSLEPDASPLWWNGLSPRSCVRRA